MISNVSFFCQRLPVMSHRDEFLGSHPRPTRRSVILGMAGLGALPGIALAQDRLQIPPRGGFKPNPIAISPLLSGSPAGAGGAARLPQGLTRNLKRGGGVAPDHFSGLTQGHGNIH